MKHSLTALACAAALFAAGAAQAAVLTFNDPGVIDISAANVATYTESGYKVSGAAASFLLIGNPPLTGVLVGGFADDLGVTMPFSLMSSTGAAFALLALDYAFYDLGTAAGTLSVTGLLNGVQVATRSFALAGQSSFNFSGFSVWGNVTEVRFNGSSGFSLDNISAVPEPSTLALSSSALVLIGLAVRKRRRRA